ncbi:MAG: sulfurtransferase FdhD, partial [Rhodoferax sp.]|nr:sulfurtransferase FdhD [Rhodoferax sp.]
MINQFPSSDPVTSIQADTGARRVPVLRWRESFLSEAEDWVSNEVAIALEFNGISHAVMLATPCD